MRYRLALLALPILFSVSGIRSLFGEVFRNSSDHWAATDALGLKLPNYPKTRGMHPVKYVGIFYFVRVGNHTPKVYDIIKILKQPASERRWGPVNSTHFWGEPEQGYFHVSDPWVIRHALPLRLEEEMIQ